MTPGDSREQDRQVTHRSLRPGEPDEWTGFMPPPPKATAEPSGVTTGPGVSINPEADENRVTVDRDDLEFAVEEVAMNGSGRAVMVHQRLRAALSDGRKK